MENNGDDDVTSCGRADAVVGRRSLLRGAVKTAAAAVLAAGVSGGIGGVARAAASSARSSSHLTTADEKSEAAGVRAGIYNQTVLDDGPVGFWTSNVDLTSHHRDGRFSGGPTVAVMPNGDHAPRYDGASQYLTISDDPDWSVTRTGSLTVEAWLRPDTLQFPHDEGFHKEYVHWLGKGTPGNHEYVARMYSLHNHAQRPNRISGYVLNPAGGLGAGSYFQDRVRVGEWIHYALVVNITKLSRDYPTGYVAVYKNGQLRDKDSLSDYSVVPQDGAAPLRVATRDLASFFEGAIGKVAVYDRELTGDQLLRHYRAMLAAQVAS